VPSYDEWRQRGRVARWVYWAIGFAVFGIIIGFFVTK